MDRWWVLLLLLLVACELITACPEGCSCHHEQDFYKANCSSLPISGGKVQVLILVPSRDSPLELSDGQFNSARHLEQLVLKNCSIYYVHKKAFYGAKSIIEIDLSYNYIEELEPTVFQHLTSLTTLSLRGNPIQFVSEVPFLISSSLQHLDIGECKLKSIPREIFYGLKRLRYLYMDGNYLKTLKYNSIPKGLKYLNLSKNLIVNVPTEVLYALTSLRLIGLSGNPINCSCSLMNLQDWFSGRGVIFEDNVTCALPSEYNGVSWSRVDENRLCLAEARREEMSHLGLYKSRLYKGSFFENENSYLGGNVQSDQPQSLHPDSQAEVLFENDKTIAMGEMMRDEEDKKEQSEKEFDDLEQPVLTENDDPTSTSKSIENEKNVEIKTTQDHNYENNDKTILMDNGDSNISSKETVGERMISLVDETENNENEGSGESEIDISAHLANLNENNTVEYNAVDDDETNTELDSLREEGLFHVESDILKSSVNDTLESTVISSDIDDLSEDEVTSTQETIFVNKLYNVSVDDDQNITSSTESKNDTFFQVSAIPENDNEEVEQPSTTLPNLNTTSETEQNTTVLTATSNENDLLVSKEKVAGAEVVMFCIVVLTTCLILYSIYKCRTKKRPKTRTVKDMESNHNTELQDMASLLPKPHDDEKKNNLKYPEKAPTNENIKLLTESNENETAIFSPVVDSKNKVDDKNSLNNNTPANPISKTPLIKPENQVTVNPMTPIQRTKVRVGIIPDSIPRTPIFLQKTYNGTKNV